MARKQPVGGKAFDELVRKLVQVPKKELDAKLRRDLRQRKKKK